MTSISYEGYEPEHLSFSTVNSYRSCSMRFKLEKVDRVEQRPGLAAMGGNAVHTLTEEIDKFIWEHGYSILEPEPTPVLDSTATSELPEPEEAPF